MFSANQAFPGITHITEGMGVGFTLFEGSSRAVLFDTGYGLEDVSAYVRSLTDKPLTVVLSHGHHDHILGARWFEKTWMRVEDREEFRLRTGAEQRRSVMRQAEGAGIRVPEDYLTAEIRMPEALELTEKTGEFDSLTMRLGGLDLSVIHVPGHTPGSLMIYVPAYGLLLTGDNWNPCTWMWFPSSISAIRWRDNMIRLTAALGDEDAAIRHVICSHQPMVRTGTELYDYLAFMTAERMREAPAVEMGSPIHTHQIRKEPEDWTLIFDRDKI